jgi:hypothetical protein
MSRRRDFPGVPPGSFEQVSTCSLDIYRRVYVSVVMDATIRTIPFSNRQRQVIQQMATRRTQFRRRKEPIQWKIGSAVPCRLVFQFAEYFTEGRVCNVFGQVMVLNHPGYIQSFDKDRLVLADDLRGEFLNGVSSGIADFGVQFGYCKSGFPAIGASLDLAGQATLKPLQSLFAPDKGAGIFEFLALAGRGQCLNADINADFGFGPLERLDVGFDKDADKIAPARIPADRQADELRVVGKGPAPYNVERLGLFGERDPSISKREGVCGIASRLSSAPRFEGRIVCSPLEEIRESYVKITERLLKHNGTDFGKKGFFRFFFPLGEFGRGSVIADGFLLLLPCAGAKLQCPIVNIASAAERVSQLSRLFISREEPKFESLLNYHPKSLHHISGLCNHC